MLRFDRKQQNSVKHLFLKKKRRCGILPSYKKDQNLVETQVDLESVIQSEVSQKEKNKDYVSVHICKI